MSLLEPVRGEPSSTPSALVLGAGLAGLTAGWSLARRGWSVTVVEREPSVGGLARTVRPAPDVAFDLGGHRFLPGEAGQLRELISLLEGEWVEVRRRSRILLDGRFFDYPLRPRQALFSFGARMSGRILADYLLGHLRSLARRREEETFEDWALARFGRTLYRIFFQPYTEKVWGFPCSELSAVWSRERIDLLHLFHAVARSLFPSRRSLPRTYASAFLYPRTGIGRIAERLAEEVIREGGETLCGMDLREIRREKGRAVAVTGVGADGRTRTWTPDQVVCTIPLSEWIPLLDPPGPGPLRDAASRLSYRHMVFVYLLLSREQASGETWVYVPSARFRTCRIHEPKNWSEKMVPPGKTSLCAELFDSQNGDLWSMDDSSVAGRVVRELAELGLIDPGWVLDSRVERVSHTHPVYRVGFQRDLEAVRRWVAGEMDNFHLLGRTGAFQYKNMDQVMVDGLRLGDNMAARGPIS